MVRFSAVKSPLDLTKNLPGGLLPHVLRPTVSKNEKIWGSNNFSIFRFGIHSGVLGWKSLALSFCIVLMRLQE